VSCGAGKSQMQDNSVTTDTSQTSLQLTMSRLLQSLQHV